MKFLIFLIFLISCDTPPPVDTSPKRKLLTAGCKTAQPWNCDSIIKEFCKNPKVISESTEELLPGETHKTVTVECD